MSKIGTIIVAVGSVPNKEELKKFHEALGRSELFRHLTKPTLVVAEGQAFNLTLYVEEYSLSLLKATLTKGPLRYWGNLFKITEGIS